MININEFPKSKKLLGEFGKRNLSAFQKNIMKEREIEGVEIPEITDEMADSYASALLTTNPRILFDFFDENEIFISIRCAAKDVFYFRWNVKFDKGNDVEHPEALGRSTASNFTTRLECEKEAFNLAFKLLEEKL